MPARSGAKRPLTQLTCEQATSRVAGVTASASASHGTARIVVRLGMESHHHNPGMYAYDCVKQAARLESERGFALREAIYNCRNGGTISMIGVYGGFMDKFPIGAVMNRALTIKTGQCHVQR
jgi:threonine dehydrogenase-like Zn-dependent dehydrogenase